MKFLEKDLEQIIYETPNEKIREKGLEINGTKKRQLRIGNYGIADLVTVERDYLIIPNRRSDGKYHGDVDSTSLLITVYELKKDKAGISAFLQAVKYCKGISSYLESRKEINFHFKIVLIGNEIDKSGSLIYLTDLIFNDSEFRVLSRAITSLEFYTYKYNIDGILFNKESDYRLTNEGFKFKI